MSGEDTEGAVPTQGRATEGTVTTGSAIDSREIPAIGFGTYQTGGYECFDATTAALEMGYRHIDTAMAYENEATIGRAIEASSVDRDDVFLTTKIKGYPELLEHDRLLEAADDSLTRLGTDYVDLLLIHWWNPGSDMAETFAAMNRLVEAGKAEHIGVSNFSVDQLRQAIQVSEAPILTNQVEYHPYWPQDELLEFCQAEDITLTAYSPLAEGLVVDDDELTQIGSRYDKSPAQVALRWLIQQENVVTIPKTVTPGHARENLDVFDFELTDHEMRTIADLEGPLWYRHNREGGLVHRARGLAGPIAERMAPGLVLNTFRS
jgi:2,5-diketo-D-gluconate reductase B